MYQKLEEEYIKNSKSKNFLKSSFIIFLVLYSITLIANNKLLIYITETRKIEINGIIKLIILVTCTCIAIIIVGSIALTLYILYKKTKSNNTNFKAEFINIIKNISNKRNEDKNLIKKFLKNNNCYNCETIQNIINHYRVKSLTSKKEISFVEILSIVLTLIYNDNENDILMIILAILIAIIIFTYIKNIKAIILVLNKKENLYENLEEILSEIHIELQQETRNIKKVKKKKSRG